MIDNRGDVEGEGDVPAYVDLMKATVERQDGIRVDLSFARRPPARMSDGKSNMVAGVDLRIRKEEVSIYAELSENGWRVHSRGSGGSEFPGKVSRVGNTLTFHVPRSVVGAARSFTWYAHSSWTKSTLTTTAYAFDRVPDLERASFPD